MPEINSSHEIAVFGGYIKTSQIMNSSSGGIAYALGEEFIKRGGFVAGVKYTSDFYNAEYLITGDLSDLSLFCGSKYIDALPANVFKGVKEKLESDQKVLFFGTPCRIAALYLYLKKDYGNRLVTCELVCHGPAHTEVHEQYLKHLEKKYNSKIVDFSVRKKIKKWLPLYLYAKFANGKEYHKEFYSTEYGVAFNLYGKKRCYSCQYRGNNRVADIQIGDFWGYDKKAPYYNKLGTSCVLVHTTKGLDFITSVSSLALFPVSFAEATKNNPMVMQTRQKDSRYDRFESLFKEGGLFYAIRKIRTFKSYLPRWMKSLIKKLLGNRA